jgi:SPP1 gp7 family putative phage head morphogenesis protein
MDILADDLCTLWTKARRTYDIFGRVAVAYISDQATPPWYSPTLNLKDNLISKDGDLDPRKGRIHFKLAQLTDRIMSEVRRGALNKETPTEIINRVKDLFPRPKTRESTWINVESAKKKKFGGGDLEIDYGTWSIDDLRDFVQQIRGANRWEYRIEKKGMPTSVTRRNKILQDLEQVLMTDAVNLLHQGEIQIGPKEMGIDDFVWKTHRQETTCPVCTKRDGKTMKWIRARIKDEFGDLAPPLHPNCNCELIPKISNEWSQKALKNMDEEWDSNTGLVYKANDLEKKYGAQDISFEEFVERFGV